VAFDQSGPRWLGISDLIAEPEGPTFISYKVARSRLNRLRFVTQDPKRTSDVNGLARLTRHVSQTVYEHGLSYGWYYSSCPNLIFTVTQDLKSEQF
jgi:hypothetical protein